MDTESEIAVLLKQCAKGISEQNDNTPGASWEPAARFVCHPYVAEVIRRAARAAARNWRRWDREDDLPDEVGSCFAERLARGVDYKHCCDLCLYGWTRAVAYNVARSLLRSERSKGASLSSEQLDLLESTGRTAGCDWEEIESLWQEARRYIRELPRLEREVVTLRLELGETFSDIARKLGLSLTAAFRACRRGVDAVKRQMKSDLDLT